MKIKFVKGIGPTVEVAHAGYRRFFVAEGEPFEVTEHEWDNHLARTGNFEIVPEEKAKEEAVAVPPSQVGQFGNIARTEEHIETESETKE